MSTATASDVARQRALDARRDAGQGALLARMAAVVGAQRALAAREPQAPYALRQSLIDLAAVAELVAEELPRPGNGR